MGLRVSPEKFLFTFHGEALLTNIGRSAFKRENDFFRQLVKSRLIPKIKTTDIEVK